MLNQRITTASLLVCLVAVALFAVPIGAFAAFCVVLCLMCVHELAKMYKFSLLGQTSLMLIVAGSCCALYFSHIEITHIIVSVIMLTWCFIVPFTLVMRPRHITKRMITILAIIIFVPAFYALVELYGLVGAWHLLSILAIAWIADTGAYYVGKNFGYHKLAPSISPNKTLEGALGALVSVFIYLLILRFGFHAMYLYNLGEVFKFSLILTSAGIIGDLFESWLKRVAKVKDSGTILPGHGGMFDRVDSMVAVVAVAFAMIWLSF